MQILIHHVCDGCDAYSIRAADFQAFVDWLAPRGNIGTVVQTTDQVIGGPVAGPVLP